MLDLPRVLEHLPVTLRHSGDSTVSYTAHTTFRRSGYSCFALRELSYLIWSTRWASAVPVGRESISPPIHWQVARSSLFLVQQWRHVDKDGSLGSLGFLMHSHAAQRPVAAPRAFSHVLLDRPHHGGRPLPVKGPRSYCSKGERGGVTSL